MPKPRDFFVLISYGVVQGLETLTAGAVYNSIMADGVVSNLERWQTFWMIPLLFFVVVTRLFALGFKDDQ